MREYKAFLCVAQALSLIFALKLGNVIAAITPIIVSDISISAMVKASALGLKGLMVKKLNGVIKSVLIKSHDNRLTLILFNHLTFKPFNQDGASKDSTLHNFKNFQSASKPHDISGSDCPPPPRFSNINKF